jgi:bacteriocin biosynthesis cyclodehydratase domain-containing protein
MVLRLDPRVPMVWRDPFSLQFGVEPARVILREVSNAQERMIAALAIGVSRPGLVMVARAAGATELDATRLLIALGPVLRPSKPEQSRHTVAIVGAGPTVDRIAGALAETGLQVVVDRSVGDIPCDLGIAIGHYVFDPDVYGFWLRRDIPHLPIVFADGSATIGPLVEPGSGPCLYCLEFYRRDADARWSTLASQLWGCRSAAETPLVSREVAAMAARMVVRRLSGGASDSPASSAATSFRIGAETGEIVRGEWMPHPDCGCLSPRPAPGDPMEAPEATEAPRGIGLAGAATTDSIPRMPTTAEAFDEPA